MTMIDGSQPRLNAHGFDVALPPQWEGRIYKRTTPSVVGGSPPDDQRRAPGAEASTYPIVHLANFALPSVRGDYGSGAVERMGGAHVFVAVLEFGPECLDSALFAPPGLPQPRPDDFAANALQRRLAGQAGFQSFCTVGGRPLGVYVVLGSSHAAARLCGDANRALRSMAVASR